MIYWSITSKHPWVHRKHVEQKKTANPIGLPCFYRFYHLLPWKNPWFSGAFLGTSQLLGSVSEDPDDRLGWGVSPRGAGYTFGQDVSEKLSSDSSDGGVLKRKTVSVQWCIFKLGFSFFWGFPWVFLFSLVFS